MSELHIPEICGAMLLPDCTLFPHGGLPLHIFEPRYRQMLQDALEGSCFFAVACLTGEETQNPAECTAPVGTVGLIRASREMEDGSSNLLLHGVIRVRFTEWIQDAPYPKARISPLPAVFEPEAQSEAAIESLREAAESATLKLPEEVRSIVLEMSQQIDDPAILADVICQQFLHEPDDRQHMLETESVAARIAWLCQELAT